MTMIVNWHVEAQAAQRQRGKGEGGGWARKGGGADSVDDVPPGTVLQAPHICPHAPSAVVRACPHVHFMTAPPAAQGHHLPVAATDPSVDSATTHGCYIHQHATHAAASRMWQAAHAGFSAFQLFLHVYSIALTCPGGA